MTTERIRRLEWDSRHFELPTGTIVAEVDTNEALTETLERARAEGLRLLYWLADDSFAPSDETLSSFGGKRIVGFRRYGRALVAADARVDVRGSCRSAVRAEPVLTRLAIMAGHMSRFRLDERLPRGRFEAMYEAWLALSVDRRLADDVLVFTGDGESPHGLATYKVKDSVGEIGLLSTLPAQRGTGVAWALVQAIHAALAAVGATRVEVSTQTENVAACRFYEKAGYTIARQGSHYHFLLPQ